LPTRPRCARGMSPYRWSSHDSPPVPDDPAHPLFLIHEGSSTLFGRQQPLANEIVDGPTRVPRLTLNISMRRGSVGSGDASSSVRASTRWVRSWRTRAYRGWSPVLPPPRPCSHCRSNSTRRMLRDVEGLFRPCSCPEQGKDPQCPGPGDHLRAVVVGCFVRDRHVVGMALFTLGPRPRPRENYCISMYSVGVS